MQEDIINLNFLFFLNDPLGTIFGCWLGSFYFCELGAHAKSRNPTTTPSGVLNNSVKKRKKDKIINLPKIVAYLSLLRWSHALSSEKFENMCLHD